MSLNINRLKRSNWSSKGKTFFTADLHLLHRNIIGYCSRPFKDENEMTNVLVRNWNKKVTEDDDVYIAGDLTMIGDEKAHRIAPIMRRLKGKKHLIYGNHDRIKAYRYVNDLHITSVHTPYLQLMNGWIIIHDPTLAVACPRDTIIIAGHVHNLHGKTIPNELGMNIFNVGVDVWDFAPISKEEIIKLIGN